MLSTDMRAHALVRMATALDVSALGIIAVSWVGLTGVCVCLWVHYCWEYGWAAEKPK